MDILSIVLSLFALLFGITIHEAAHALSAKKLGDPTAADLGRLSMNPLVHIDLITTVLLPAVLVLLKAPAFGWAKPVPLNAHNLRHPRRDGFWISLAGPAANIATAGVALVLLYAVRIASPGATEFLRKYVTAGQHLPPGFYPLEGLALVLYTMVWVNGYLGVFNLIPVPPLDGAGALAGILPEARAAALERFRPFGLLIVLVLIMFGILEAVSIAVRLLTNVFLFL
jgi:Zn-dependent protease